MPCQLCLIEEYRDQGAGNFTELPEQVIDLHAHFDVSDHSRLVAPWLNEAQGIGAQDTEFDARNTCTTGLRRV